MLPVQSTHPMFEIVYVIGENAKACPFSKHDACFDTLLRGREASS